MDPNNPGIHHSVRTTALVFLAAVAGAGAEVRLPQVFGDHMVLQRDASVPVWGTAAAGEQVTVDFAGRRGSATAGPDGKWLVRLEPLAAEADGRALVVRGDRGSALEIHDVVVGEVWLCAGQSNMEMGLAETAGGAREIAAADHPAIRLLDSKGGPWRPCTPSNAAQGLGTGYGPDGAGGCCAVGYFFGREVHEALQVPVGLITAARGGSLLDQWLAPSGELYQSMVAPLVPMAIRGLLWYQGEGDCANHKADTYGERMKVFVEGWRKVWGQGDFPVYSVQVAPFNYVKHNGVRTPFELPLLWEAQSAALALPNTGMAATMDLGEIDNIHPVRKKEVGHRLALLALAKTYHRDHLVYSGPVFRSMKVEGDHVRLSFDGVGGGLTARDGKPLTCFEIAENDGVFVPAEARLEGNSVVVWDEELPEPVAVRFAWNQTAQPNLTNKEGLPALPFRTKNESTQPGNEP